MCTHRRCSARVQHSLAKAFIFGGSGQSETSHAFDAVSLRLIGPSGRVFLTCVVDADRWRICCSTTPRGCGKVGTPRWCR
eukprot:3795188-Pyramimonas_sp.AAC.2